MNQAPPAPAAARERVRSTERVESPSGPLARKLFRARPLLERLGLRAPAAAREHSMLMRLRERGLPVPEPVALRLRGGPRGEDVLETRWMEGARDLAAAWSGGALDPGRRRRIARELGSLVRALHDAGVVHHDLHAGNVLWSPAGGLALVDFHRAGGAGDSVRDLLALDHFFHRRARAAEKLRFLRSYGGAWWPAGRAARRARLAELAARAAASRHAFLVHHERRCDGGGRAFERVGAGGWRGAGRREWSARLLAEIGGDPESCARSRGRLVHAGGGAELWRLESASLPFPLAIKLLDDRGAWKRALRGSRARRAWRNLFRLEMAELDPPRAVAWLASPGRAGAPRSVLVTEFLDGLPMLHDHVAAAGVAAAWPLLEELARALARMHDEGLSHRDLKAENLLVDAAAGRCRFVDADGVRRLRRVGPDRVARDLARLNASFRDLRTVTWRHRRRFLAAYRGARRHDRPATRELLRAIARLTTRKWNQATNDPR